MPIARNCMRKYRPLRRQRRFARGHWRQSPLTCPAAARLAQRPGWQWRQMPKPRAASTTAISIARQLVMLHAIVARQVAVRVCCQQRRAGCGAIAAKYRTAAGAQSWITIADQCRRAVAGHAGRLLRAAATAAADDAGTQAQLTQPRGGEWSAASCRCRQR